jgi:dATP/dGTP diphosphohydrolase
MDEAKAEINALRSHDLLALLERVADWGEAQFPGSTWLAKGKHLVEEAEEARDAEGDGEELADVLMILAHMIRQAKVDIYAEVERKLAICQARQWLPPDADGISRHADLLRLGQHKSH